LEPARYPIYFNKEAQMEIVALVALVIFLYWREEQTDPSTDELAE